MLNNLKTYALLLLLLLAFSSICLNIHLRNKVETLNKELDTCSKSITMINNYTQNKNKLNMIYNNNICIYNNINNQENNKNENIFNSINNINKSYNDFMFK